MRALVVEEYGPWDSHALTDRAVPYPGPGQIVVETRAMSLNFPDVLLVEGLYQHRPQVPFVAGFDCAGVVLDIGEGVTRASIGDRVLVYAPDGAFAEAALVPETSVYQMPDGMTFEAAAAFGLTYLTAHVSLIDNAHCKPGETVLVTGASGGVGLAMIQYGAALGLRMIGGVTSPLKANLVVQNGAEAAVDLAAEPLRETVRAQVNELTDDRGVDVVMDMVGGDVFDGCLRALTYGGRIAIVGFAGGRIPEIKANYLLLKKITAIGSPLGSRRSDTVVQRDNAMDALLDAWAAGKLNPVVQEVLPMEEWKIAFGRFKRREVTGKIVLVP